MPREWVQIDSRRRLVIPAKFIEALGITEEDLQEKYPLLVEAHPGLEGCKYLSIKKR